jgi:2-oxoisovalerate dehydrogenase E2 component (dihydrolipoyl transacylase)
MDFQLPEIGEGVYEAEVVRWLVKPGDAVKRGQGLVEVMTDKATMEVPAPFAGSITRLSAEPGQRIQVGDAILSYEPSGGRAVPEPAEPAASKARASGGASGKASTTTMVGPPANGPKGPGDIATASPVAAPSVRHLARKLGIDLAGIRGTGPGGRILVDDLTPFLRPKAEQPATAATVEPPRLDFGKAGTRIKLVGLRRKIAEHMTAAKRHIPHYSYVDECDLTELVRLRQLLREPCARKGLKVTYLSFFVKAAALALQEVPIVNSTFDEKADEIVLHDHYHIGIAVASPGGLIVPVLHDADKKDLFTIAAEIERLGNEAKTGRAKLEDLRGGTFTVTSIGNIGGLISTPIINHPEVGIVGIGKVVKRPVYDEAGNIRPADLVYLSFSFDHRVVDGAVGASFGNVLMRHLQNPAALLLPEKLKP